MNRYLFKILKRGLHLTNKRLWNVTSTPELDFNYLLNKGNAEEISKNISRRKGIGDIKRVHDLRLELDKSDPRDQAYNDVRNKFYSECLGIPNKTHPAVANYGDDSKVIKTIGTKKVSDNLLDFQEISKRLNITRMEHLGNVTGTKSYFLQGALAELETALVRYTLDSVKANKFEVIIVPDILHRDIIEACGLNTRGQRTQVFALDKSKHDPDLCLSGTSEMALASYLMNSTLKEEDLPRKLATVSRCFRAETSNLSEEKGIFRVHEFTKVELFIACKPEKSEQFLQEIRDFEEKHFSDLGIHFRILDMAPPELGAPAYRKYDIEAWMPGRNAFGEISSCSNCTDYQSRRLNIKYKRKDGTEEFVHTLNGTACAVPRMLIALVETYQNSNGTIGVPNVLRKYFGERGSFGREKRIPGVQFVKMKKLV